EPLRASASQGLAVRAEGQGLKVLHPRRRQRGQLFSGEHVPENRALMRRARQGLAIGGEGEAGSLGLDVVQPSAAAQVPDAQLVIPRRGEQLPVGGKDHVTGVSRLLEEEALLPGRRIPDADRKALLLVDYGSRGLAIRRQRQPED